MPLRARGICLPNRHVEAVQPIEDAPVTRRSFGRDYRVPQCPTFPATAGA